MAKSLDLLYCSTRLLASCSSESYGIPTRENWLAPMFQKQLASMFKFVEAL